MSNLPPDSPSSTITVAGCGAMGLPMAKNLLLNGFKVNGFDIRPEAAFSDSGLPMLPLSRLAECDILISVVRDQQQTDSLCFGEQGVFLGAEYPATLVVCSTLRPGYIKELQQQLPADVALVDAPMSGASVAAIEATLTFMLGGAPQVLDRLGPMFDAMGAKQFRAGETGTGMTLKVLNNYVAATSVVAVRRVLKTADSFGVSESLLRDVMSESSGATWFGQLFDKIDWSREGYAPDNTIGILEKDVTCALDIVGSSNPGIEQSIDTCKVDAETKFDQALLDALRSLESVKP